MCYLLRGAIQLRIRARPLFIMSEVLVIGHRNPDTDAICSAIGYAEFKKLSGFQNVVAARCGDTNERIDFVLRYFGVPKPMFVTDVSPRVRDVMNHTVVSVPPSTSAGDALTMMDETNIRVLPVITNDGRCHGMVSVFKASKFFFPDASQPLESRRIMASVRNLSRTLKGSMLFATDADREEDLLLMIGAMKLDSFSRRLQEYPREKLVVVVGDRLDIQMLAIQQRVRVIIVTGGLPVDPEILASAKSHEVAVVLSPHDSATTAMLCRTAITVSRLLDTQFITFNRDEPLIAAKRTAASVQHQAFPVIDEVGRVVGILSKSDFLKKVERQLILVDHNELSQAVSGADQVEILEVIDHHRIGSFTTPNPILFRNEPVGSTSTIVADCFFRFQVALSRPTAGLLLAGLVSDTLNLNSPTTTAKDVEILRKLEEIAGIKATDFTEKLFESGSVLISRPISQAITTDCKEYKERDRIFSVAQIEEVGFEHFDRRRPELMEALKTYRKEHNYFFSALLVTDVVLQTSMLVIAGEMEMLRQIDYPEVELGFYQLAGVVSRKKQLLPYLTHCLERIG